MSPTPKIVYWKWTPEELVGATMRQRAQELIDRTGFDLVLVGATDARTRLDDPRLVNGVREACELFAKHGRRVAFCLDPRDEKLLYLERGLPTLGFVDSARRPLDGTTWRSEVGYFHHRFGDHVPDGAGALAVFALDPVERVEPRGHRSGNGWVEVDLPDTGRDGLVFARYRTAVPDVFSPEIFGLQRELFGLYADTGLGGVMLDEWGTVPHPKFDFSRAWARPWYSPGLADAYERRTGRPLTDDLPRLGRPYYDTLRELTVAFEQHTYDETKRHFGADAFVGAHPTWWGLDDDHQAFELWKNGFNWWDVPRDYAQTDEDVAMGVRLSLARRAGRLPFWNMWYSFTDASSYYRESWRNARYGGRTHYLGYGSAAMDFDACWALEERLKPLDDFLGSFPATQVLLVIDHDAICDPDRNVGPDGTWRFGQDAIANALRSLRAVWDAGFVAELIPSYATPSKDYACVLRIDGTEAPGVVVTAVSASKAECNDVPSGVRYEDGSVVCTADGDQPVGNVFTTSFSLAGSTVSATVEDFLAVGSDLEPVAGRLLEWHTEPASGSLPAPPAPPAAAPESS